MKSGKVAMYNEEKGFGFISPEEGGEDLFFHLNDVQGAVKEGDTVLFEAQETHKGLNAVSVSKKPARVVLIEGFKGNDK